MKKAIIILIAIVAVGAIGVAVYSSSGSGLKGSAIGQMAARQNLPKVQAPAASQQQAATVNLGTVLSKITPSIKLKDVYITNRGEEVTYYKPGVVIEKAKITVDGRLDPKYQYKMYVGQGGYGAPNLPDPYPVLLEAFFKQSNVKEYPFTGVIMHELKTHWYSFILVGYLNGEAKVASKMIAVY
ncbi:MAG: hypothetical protein US89_C0014G0024 [Candidatus Peregrinibacteria bacterium GW2011_GWF2_38_29]|nr:MAG: hypothetical protein US89_C0014G0024 [Candidatus Peregrinibacteria bacterium GW2011_GWF2_38_29]HBB02568.1 hypothetical protein [Candidatus Peregrinibacteria bacterium]